MKLRGVIGLKILCLKYIYSRLTYQQSSVVDPERFDVDSDPNFYAYEDPDPNFLARERIVKEMRCGGGGVKGAMVWRRGERLLRSVER